MTARNARLRENFPAERRTLPTFPPIVERFEGWGPKLRY